MAIQVWNDNEHVRVLPSIETLTEKGKRGWDVGIEYTSPGNEPTVNSRATFTMPSFGRQGRWGNMVFQYLFMRLLALNNDRDIELYRSAEWINNRLGLYKDMQDIPNVQTRSNAFLINDYQFQTGYIPQNSWRAMYVTNVRHQKCYVLKNVDAAVSQPLPLPDDEKSVEVEGAFLMKLYSQQHKEFILTRLFQPSKEFEGYIDDCLKELGSDKTIIGIHIRRGDTIRNPLGQQFDLPIPVRYFIEWLQTNIPLLKNPVLYISSDDPHAHKEIEVAGVEIFHKKNLLPVDDRSSTYKRYEQLDWEILRRCDILLTSNSTFSFSAALLNTKNPISYRFSVKKQTFEQFEPWDSDPLQIYSLRKYLWTTLYSRFTLVLKMVSLRKACARVVKDVIIWMYWKKTKVKELYYLHGFSLTYIGKILNLWELFQIPQNNRVAPKRASQTSINSLIYLLMLLPPDI